MVKKARSLETVKLVTVIYAVAFFSAACECNSKGSLSEVCDAGGKCRCLGSFTGLQCDQCAPGYYSYPECNCEGTLPSGLCPSVVTNLFRPILQLAVATLTVPLVSRAAATASASASPTSMGRSATNARRDSTIIPFVKDATATLPESWRPLEAAGALQAENSASARSG